jgi:ankyrin repeat protein
MLANVRPLEQMKKVPNTIIDAFESGDLGILNDLELNTKKEFGSKGKTLLHIAAKYTSSVEIIRFIIRKIGISPRSTCLTARKTALHYACRKGCLAVVRFLVEDCRTNINASMKGKMTPVLIAAKYQRTDIVFYIISKGGNIHHTDIRGWGLVHFAAKSGNYELLIALECLGLSLHSLTKNNELPLHLASESGNIAVIRHLMSIGQDIYAYDSKGKNILEHATDWMTIHWILSNTLWVIMKDKVLISLLKLKAPIEILLHYCEDYLRLGHAVIFDRQDIIQFLVRTEKVKLETLINCSLGKNVSKWVANETLWKKKLGLLYVYKHSKLNTPHLHLPFTRLPSCLIREIAHYL